MKANTENKNILVEQSLHGYKSGHTLIASSSEFPVEAKRTLQILSDMSGPSMLQGYETYFTGYPVRELNAYAIAKTWYAPEMARPGCVWTHTILIRFSDLIRLDNLYNILSLFVRPDEGIDLKYYSSPLEINLQKKSEAIRDYEPSYIRGLVLKLYSRDDISILIHQKNSKELEKLLFELWFQQWPRLKRNFTFCTGAISPRNISGRPFDLQVVPFNESSIKKTTEISFYSDADKPLKGESSNWDSIIVNDLFKPSALRLFLNMYGADVKPSRSSFRSLVILFDQISAGSYSGEMKPLVDFLGKEFSTPEVAQNLKLLLLLGYSDSRSVEKETQIILELFTTKLVDAFPIDKLLLSERVLELYKRDQQEAVRTLSTAVELGLNSAGINSLNKMATSISEVDLEEISSFDRRLGFMLIFMNPTFLYSDRFWNVNKQEQRDRLEVLLHSEIRDKIDWRRIVTILLEQNISIDIDVIESVDLDFVAFALNWYGTSSKAHIGYHWTNVLKQRQKELIGWLSKGDLRERSVEFTTGLISPNSREVLNCGTLVWEEILENEVVKNNKLLKRKIAVLGLTVAFNNPDKGSLALLTKTVEPAFQWIFEGNIEYDFWKHLERHAPSIGWLSDWDKGKRLTLALVEKFRAFKWPAAHFGKLFKDRDVAQKVLRHYNDIF